MMSKDAEQHIVARLALEDGSVFSGRAFGRIDPRTIDGEVCFNTSLCGYQEILTDPSYAGQIVTMTYPLIGNYGVNDGDLESGGVHVRGFVVRELSNRVSNYRSTSRLEGWLDEIGVTGIEGLDTRALTRKLRIDGAMKGVLSTAHPQETTDAALVEAARKSVGLVGQNLVQSVSRKKAGVWDSGLCEWGEHDAVDQRFKVVAIDCGAKLNILRNLVQSGCEVSVVPFDTPAAAILERKPDGLFVSNGPGDPSAVVQTIKTLKEVRGKLPIFGICLGHQLLSLSLGATTYKLKFGHRGGNQPVQNIGTGKVEITSQNHGFAVDVDSLKQAGGEPTHINLNDQTLEGFRHDDDAVFAVQYHPEASPGPHDAAYLFDCYIEMMKNGSAPSAEQMDQAQRKRSAVQTVSTT